MELSKHQKRIKAGELRYEIEVLKDGIADCRSKISDNQDKIKAFRNKLKTLK